MLFPKTPRQENRALLDLARGKPCLMLATAGCEMHYSQTTVAAHANWSDLGGKGAHRKADDSYSVWSCYRCHAWLDQGIASKAEKREAWQAGHELQIAWWGKIVAEKMGKLKEIQAAKWALDLLKNDSKLVNKYAV